MWTPWRRFRPSDCEFDDETGSDLEAAAVKLQQCFEPIVFHA
jgi:hypothetical protein